jgi:G protein-coupled receptor 158
MSFAGYAMYRLNDSQHILPPVREDSINILYEDGHWSKPYFDCKGGDIWMMTFTVPFFGWRNNKYFFK